jgi:hypothetical protein
MFKYSFLKQVVVTVTLILCMGKIAGNNLLLANSQPSIKQDKSFQQHKKKTNNEQVADDLNKKYLEYSQLYKAAQSEVQRRATCLEILDRKLVIRGNNISIIDNIFGESFSANLPDKNELTTIGKVFFSPQPQNDDPTVSTPNIGWYLAVEYDWKGQLNDFYLSNTYK